MRRSSLGATSLGATIAVLAAANADAQRLTGSVTDGGVRVPGAIVMLVGANGTIAGRVVTREDGRYNLAASAPGKYSVRVLRIGRQPTTVGPFDLAIGSTLTKDVAISGRVSVLPTIEVTDRSRCQVRPDSSAAAFRLWDAARTALLATMLTQSEPLGVRLTQSERTLDADGRNVVADSTSTVEGTSRKPFVTLSPDSLARSGYAESDARGGTTYWAPDAEVLLSESFAASHCIHAELPPSDTGWYAGVLGVAFEPVSKGEHADVRGVLWIDRASAELRSLDYSYVNVAPIVERAGAGGHVEFLRLPDGTWTVSRWWIRSPMVETTISRGASPLPGAPPSQQTSRRLLGIRETRADLLEVRRGDATWWERGRVSVALRVTDSSGTPLRALVSLNDSTRSVSTGDDGVVRFDRIQPGAARVDIRIAGLDSLGAPRMHVALTVPDHTFEPLSVRVPSPQEFFEGRCGADALEWNEGAIRGMLGASGAVEVSWEMPYARLGGGAPVVVHEVRRATTDAQGAFFACGVPRALPVTVRVVSGPEDRVRLPARTAAVPAGGYVAIVQFDR